MSSTDRKIKPFLVYLFGILNVIASLFIILLLVSLLYANFMVLNGFQTSGKSEKVKEATTTALSITFLGMTFNILHLLVMTVLNLIVSIKLIVGVAKNNMEHFRAWFYIHPIFLMSLTLTTCFALFLGFILNSVKEKDEAKINGDDSLWSYKFQIIGFLVYICLESLIIKRFFNALTLKSTGKIAEV